jgi:DNA-binding CsgD family transcriptional regulator
MFRQHGAVLWLERTFSELRPSGARGEPVAPLLDPLGALTPQETRTARITAVRLSNRVIVGILFLSPRTVGYHLHRRYLEPGVSSRTELARLLLADV